MEILEQSYQCLKICLHYSQIAINKRHTFYIVIGFCRPIFQLCKTIWHVQVPFLARLASIFRKNLGGAIITHVHIIPWKGYYDSDEIKFNKIYASYVDGYIHDLGNDRFEEYAYSVSDLVICVTESGKKHIMDTYIQDQENNSISQHLKRSLSNFLCNVALAS